MSTLTAAANDEDGDTIDQLRAENAQLHQSLLALHDTLEMTARAGAAHARALAELEAQVEAIGAGGVGPLIRPQREGGSWNPLDDDGDALRLAVKLRLRLNREINCGDDIVEVYGPEADDMSCHCATESVDGDQYAATRRAIVRAAAEIGRSMK